MNWRLILFLGFLTVGFHSLLKLKKMRTYLTLLVHFLIFYLIEHEGSLICNSDFSSKNYYNLNIPDFYGIYLSKLSTNLIKFHVALVV